MTDHHIEDHDRGLDHDLPRLISRRRAVGLLAGGLGSAFLAACGGSSGGSETARRARRPRRPPRGRPRPPPAPPREIPEETAGPFPGDGSNGPNVLTESGVVRRDITKSFGGASGVAEGVPTTVELTLLDVAGGGKPLAGAAVYLWHCDMAGRYSLYDQDVIGGELPARRAGERRRRQARLRDDLPGRLPGPLAAHALRDLREPRRGGVRWREAAHLAARGAEGGLRRGLRDRRLRAERPEPRADVARRRHGLQRRVPQPARDGVRQRERHDRARRSTWGSDQQVPLRSKKRRIRPQASSADGSW